MIPLSDSNPTRRIPFINWTLIAINVIVFFYELTLRPRVLDNLIMAWGAVPTNILYALTDPLQAPLPVWLTLVTSQFLHGGWFHIIGNMLFLWVFGDNIEDVLGHFSYLIFYLVCGVIAGIVQSVVEGPTRIPSIGASGAIAGVLGAYIILYPWARIRILIPVIFFLWTIQVPALIVLGWWFIQQFFYGAAALSSTAASGIALWAHIGGFVAGMLLILPFIGRVYGRPRASNYYGYDDYL
jgi:membrane associated rhomboid family serine protease